MTWLFCLPKSGDGNPSKLNFSKIIHIPRYQYVYGFTVNMIFVFLRKDKHKNTITYPFSFKFHKYFLLFTEYFTIYLEVNLCSDHGCT